MLDSVQRKHAAQGKTADVSMDVLIKRSRNAARAKLSPRAARRLRNDRESEKMQPLCVLEK